ncbi:MAG TPA: glycosyltransferase, partial [Thermoanaerobaculia bacterium]|nr:glycosyltransferase [Thermoanaerobaculia bacterium]
CPTSLIEALSYALPAASSNIGPMPEVGGDAMLYFDPFDPAAIGDALLLLMQSKELRSDLSRRAAERAQTWPGEGEVAKRTIEAIRDVAAVRNGCARS